MFVIPVVFNKLTILQCMYLSNKTLFDSRSVYSIYYIRNNYMFRHLTVAIFRLYTKYLVNSYTGLIMGCIQWYSTGCEVGTRSHMCHGVWEVWVHGGTLLLRYA